MQEHIRRAHPEHYISKLPATAQSFELMINSPPHDPNEPRPPPNQHSYGASSLFTSAQFSDSQLSSADYVSDTSGFYDHHSTSPVAARQSNDFRRGSFMPTASAAAALAQLHNSRPESDWEADRVSSPSTSQWAMNFQPNTMWQDHFNDPETDASFNNYFTASDPQNVFADSQPGTNDGQHRHSLLASSHFAPVSSRSNSLQPFPRSRPRPRKSSITESARRPKHERQKSREQKRLSHERKAISAEPGMGDKKWADLLDAAASATEEDSRDLTPVGSPDAFPYLDLAYGLLTLDEQIPQSPRGSLPPFQPQNHNQLPSYNASPLQNTILPQSPEQPPSFDPPPHLEPFPSVESFDTGQSPNQQPYHHTHHSSADSSISNPYSFHPSRPHAASAQTHSSASGSNFHMGAEGLSSSSNDAGTLPHAAPSRQHMHSYSAPSQYSTASAHGAQLGGSSAHMSSTAQQAPPSAVVQHYCAACHRVTPLSTSYACVECICGICRDCVDVLVGMGPDRGAACPRCNTVGGRFKPFMLDLR